MNRPSLFVLSLLLLALPVFAAREKLELAYHPLPLPGAPAAIVAADLDGDGLRDLTVVVAYTRWGQMEVMESATMDDVEGLVEVLSVIPSLVDRREIRVFPGRPGGGFGPGSVALPIDTSILSVEAGPPGVPVLALTDDGLSALRMKTGTSGTELSWETLVAERSVLSGTGTFLPNLGLVRDVDGDGRADVLLPTLEGVSVYLSNQRGQSDQSDAAGLRRSSQVRFPLDDLQREGEPLVRRYPLPDLRDVNGDRLPDLVLQHAVGGVRGFRVLLNLGEGRFGEPLAPLGDFQPPGQATTREERQTERESQPEPVWFGDLDGDGRAEYVTQKERKVPEDAGMREELKAAKKPRFTYRFHRSRADLTMETKAYQEMEIEGYGPGSTGDDGDGGGDGSSGFRLAGGFKDLNGDGRQDLVAMTLDFSMLQAVKVLTVRRIGIGLDFHLWCQGDQGFRPVKGLDLSGKFNLNLNNLKIGNISQFAGDFDGDSRPEFVQMGRGRTVTVHRGRQDCAYNARPDLTLQLEEEPRDLSLVQIRDLDGDALSDVLVIQPQPPRRSDDKGVTLPVRLDLYLSGGGR